MNEERKCYICEKPAVWSYMPGEEDFCDDCVPRGCSCNIDVKPEFEYLYMDEKYKDSPLWQDPNIFEEKLDEKGRRYPCCEYMEIL